MKCPESIEELEKLEEDWIPLCRKGLYEQTQARKKADPDKSERAIAKELAEETGESESAVRSKIVRERQKEESGSVEPPPQCGIDVPEEKKEGEYKYNETYEVSDAMSFATIAISQLERIDPDDPKRKEALEWVDEWIINNI